MRLYTEAALNTKRHAIATEEATGARAIRRHVSLRMLPLIYSLEAPVELLERNSLLLEVAIERSTTP